MILLTLPQSLFNIRNMITITGFIGAVVLLISFGITGATIGMISAPNGHDTILLSGLIVKLEPSYSPDEILIILGTVLLFTVIFPSLL